MDINLQKQIIEAKEEFQKQISDFAKHSVH